jgi:methionyl-tRNA formyltransferase
VIQPRRLKEPEAMDQLQVWSPDVIVVAAFGQILRQEVLDLPPYGCLNVHASLLPRWRGAAPIQAAILAGDEQTGVTIMRMDSGIDTGPLLSQAAIPIMPTDTAGSLRSRLAELGAELLLKTLPEYLNGELEPVAQEDESATYAPMLKKETGRLDLAQPAASLARQVRAYHPWPGSFLEWQGQALKIHQAHAFPCDPDPSLEPGQTLIFEGLPALVTSDGLLVLDNVQPAGKRSMAGDVFLNGARKWGAA